MTGLKIFGDERRLGGVAVEMTAPGHAAKGVKARHDVLYRFDRLASGVELRP
jgi:hypothetical protein